MIGLEGHGREDIAAGIDTSRTVGWFTSLYPVVLEVPASPGADALIKSVKEQLRRVPDKGMGYGVLKIYQPGSRPGGTGPAGISYSITWGSWIMCSRREVNG